MKRISSKLMVGIIAFFAISCAPPPEVTTTVSCRMTKFSIDSEQKLTIELDEKKHITQVIFGNTDSTLVVEYNSNGRIGSARLNDSENKTTRYTTYTYNSKGLVSKSTDYTVSADDNLTEVAYQAYKYNPKNQLSKRFYYMRGASVTYQLVGYHFFDYNRAGNATHEEIYNDAGLMHVIEYEYETGTNPFRLLFFLFNRFPFEHHETISTNNIKKAVWRDAENTILSPSYVSSYEYNEDNYPTKESRLLISEGGDGFSMSFTYECK